MKNIIVFGLLLILSAPVLAVDLSVGSGDSAGVSRLTDLYLADDLHVADDTALDGNVLTGTMNFGTGTGVNSIVVVLDPAPTAYTTGMAIYFTSASAATGACSVNVNSWGWKPLLKLNDQAIANTDIEADGIVHAVYDGTSFQMMNPEHN